MKPLVVEEYNQNMGGVDTGKKIYNNIYISPFCYARLLYHHNNTGDKLESYYRFSHRTIKWWKRLFFHQIDMAIVNAYILYLMSPCTGKRLTHSQFRVELAKQLLMEEVIPVEEPEGRPLGPHLDPNPPSSRLTGRHFPGKLGSTTAGHPRQQQCVVCSLKKGRRRTTTYECKQCKLPMSRSLF